MSKLEAANLLQALASEFERLGLEVRRTPHLFADNGISIGKAGALRVHLYVTASGPTARVTEHGGRQWTLACATADELRHAALSALQTDRTPPSSLWRLEDEYLYHAWFLDPRMPEGDQDREWVACFVVRACSPAEAQAWGDHLSRARAERAGEPFLSSGVGPMTESAALLPVVNAGLEASDRHIGW